MKTLILGGEVGEGSMQLLYSSHNVFGGDRCAGTKHLKMRSVLDLNAGKKSPAGAALSALFASGSSAFDPQTD